MYWPVNHIIPPAEDALTCSDCHTKRASKRLNWEALGYEGDPAYRGVRFE